jgi:VWFA-related protein
MLDNDLVAIVRVVGGKGLLQQFTSDRALLRRAIKSITPTINPWSASEEPDPTKMANPQRPTGDSPLAENPESTEMYSANDDVVRLIRGMSTLTTAGFVIDSLREVPGLKNLVIVSAGIPIFENVSATSGSTFNNVTSLINRLTDKAVRSSVVINTLDPRGLRATPGVVSFKMTPARSALGGNDPNDATFGRGGALDQATFGPLLAGGSEHLGLSTVAKATGGVSVINTNNFTGGLDKVLARSKGYYELGYAPGGTFDRKFHKIEVKIKRDGARVYHHAGYVAYEDRSRNTPRTKEQEVARAAMSPLASRDIDVTPNVSIKFAPNGDASLDIHMLIAGNKLNFTEADGKYQSSLDIVGFVFDQMGRQLGGFSETVDLNLSGAQYRRAITEGITYSASTQVPAGSYQVRSVVREGSSGRLGTFSKYLEIPDLTKGKLAISSLFMFALESGQSTNPIPLLGLRQLTRKQDLRYGLTVYNAKVKDGKPQARSQVIISRDGNVLFQEPEEVLVGTPNQPLTKIGQLGLSKVAPGRYILTIVISDINDNKVKLARSLDFTVVN